MAANALRACGANIERLRVQLTQFIDETTPLLPESETERDTQPTLGFQRVLQRAAPYAYIRYPERTYRVDFTPQAEQRLLDLLASIRRDERRGAPARSHEQPARCRACGYRTVCDQRLE